MLDCNKIKDQINCIFCWSTGLKHLFVSVENIIFCWSAASLPVSNIFLTFLLDTWDKGRVMTQENGNTERNIRDNKTLYLYGSIHFYPFRFPFFNATLVFNFLVTHFTMAFHFSFLFCDLVLTKHIDKQSLLSVKW